MSEQKKGLPSLGRYFGIVLGALMLIAVGIFNTWASLDTQENNTLSAWVTYPTHFFATALPIGLAGVLGHWCSRGLVMRDGSPLPELPGGPLPFIGLVACLGVLDVLLGGRISNYPFILLALAGLPLGAASWAMRAVAT
jgi:hypothetical protein